MSTEEVDNKLYKIYDQTTFDVDTGADHSLLKPSERHDELVNRITVEDFEGNSRNKKVWRKDKINVIFGGDNLLCPEDLIKIGKIGVVDQNKEIERIVRESELSDKGGLEVVLRKYSDYYSRSKNDCGKVDCKYQHVIQGGIPPPQRQYKINSAAEQEISETIKELAQQGIITKLKPNQLVRSNSPLQAVAKNDGTWRLVTNYKALNKLTVPDTRGLYHDGR